MEDLKVTVEFIRSTKNKHVYSDDDEGVFGALYIPKELMPTDPPNILVITVEELVS